MARLLLIVGAQSSSGAVRTWSGGRALRFDTRRGLALAALVPALAAALWLGVAAWSRSPSQAIPRTSATTTGLTLLPAQARGQIAGALSRSESAYRASAVPGGFLAANSAQHLSARFGDNGALLNAGRAWLALRLVSLANGPDVQAFGPAPPTRTANVIDYARAGVSEWYSNSFLGLEQGFTIARSSSAARASALTLSLAYSGDLTPALTRAPQGLIFSHAGRPLLRYGDLVATDARGHVLPSSLALRQGRIAIHVDAAGAQYPIRVDPVVEQARLSGREEVGSGIAFGDSVALSADGNTALVGAAEDNSRGAAWVFTRSGGTWTQQGPKLTGGEEAGVGFFGREVALSADGNTALIGGEMDNSSVGAAWVFTRSGGTWTQQGPKLTGGEEVGHGAFGSSVALSGDGNTALVGGAIDNHDAGAAWFFTRSGSAWAQQGPKLTGAGEIGNGFFGARVALSGDGHTALVGASGDNGNAGAAWVYARSGATWAEQGPKLTGSGEVPSSLTGGFGDALALSFDGNTAMIGDDVDNGFAGAVWAFTRSGSAWSQQGPKLTGGEEVGGGQFGQSVSLSAAGNTALIGGAGDESGDGAAWMFTRSGSTWSQQGAKITPAERREALFGQTVALSSEGTTALIGGPAGNGNAWVFVAPSPVERAEYVNWTLSGSVTDKRLGQAITLPAGSSFNGSGEVNRETGQGSVKGSIAVPPFTTAFRLFGVLPLSLGMTVAQATPIEGTVASSETVAGDETLTIPLKLNVGVTSLSVLGLEMPVSCSNREPASLSLVDNLTREELLTTGWQFSGTTSLSKFKCGGLFGPVVSVIVSALLAGPEDPFSINFAAPAH